MIIDENGVAHFPKMTSDMANFFENMRSHMRESPEDYEGITLDQFLEQMAALVNSSNGDLIPQEPATELSVENFCQIIFYAAAYE